MYVKSGKGCYDIRQHKQQMRDKFKKIRENFSEEEKMLLDETVTKSFLETEAYKNCDVLLSYVSTPIEVDTTKIIISAIDDGKTVAVPKCVTGTRDMIFFVINSFEQLEKGAFSVLEPSEDKCDELKTFDNAVCIVPALAYDMNGYRLGYGKGYYDRFLSSHKGLFNVGIGYGCCTVQKLMRGKYDVPVNMLITDKYSGTVK